jgi:hypothetical protein
VIATTFKFKICPGTKAEFLLWRGPRAVCCPQHDDRTVSGIHAQCWLTSYLVSQYIDGLVSPKLGIRKRFDLHHLETVAMEHPKSAGRIIGLPGLGD